MTNEEKVTLDIGGIVMTEKEYDALDELLTKTTPKVGANGTGFVSKRNESPATHKSPAEIIGVMVREKIAEV